MGQAVSKEAKGATRLQAQSETPPSQPSVLIAATGAPATITCVICAEDRRPTDFPTEAIGADGCKHPLTDICRACITRHIHAELDTRGTAVWCPICPAPLAYADVWRLRPPPTSSTTRRATNSSP